MGGFFARCCGWRPTAVLFAGIELKIRFDILRLSSSASSSTVFVRLRSSPRRSSGLSFHGEKRHRSKDSSPLLGDVHPKRSLILRPLARSQRRPNFGASCTGADEPRWGCSMAVALDALLLVGAVGSNGLREETLCWDALEGGRAEWRGTGWRRVD